MAYFQIPTKKEFQKNPGFKGMSWDKVYKDFICDICKEHLKESDLYIVVRTDDEVKKDGLPGYRHIHCDPDWNK